MPCRKPVRLSGPRRNAPPDLLRGGGDGLEKTLEIKRKAQRFVQNGDLDRAVEEYQKLLAADDSDPYTHVTLGDLYFKKGVTDEAGRRYLEAAEAYRKAGAGQERDRRLQEDAAPQPATERHAPVAGRVARHRRPVARRGPLLEPVRRPRAGPRPPQRGGRGAGEGVEAPARRAEVPGAPGRTVESRGREPQGVARADPRGPRPREDRAQWTRPRSAAIVPRTSTPAPRELPEESPFADGRTAAARPSPAATGPRTAGRARRRIGTLTGSGRSRAAGRYTAARRRAHRGSREHAHLLPVVRRPDGPRRGDGPAEQPARGARARARSARAGRRSRRISIMRGCCSAGDEREQAAEALLRAAQAWESVGGLEQASSIYHELSRSPQATERLYRLWLANCERRQQWVEAAAVCCELGDFALAAQEPASAHEWFVQARAYDPEQRAGGPPPRAPRRLGQAQDRAAGDSTRDRVTVSQRMPEDLDVDLVRAAVGVPGRRARTGAGGRRRQPL